MNRFGNTNYEHPEDRFSDHQRYRLQLGDNAERPWENPYDPERNYRSFRHAQAYYNPYRTGYVENAGNRHFYAGAHNDYPANDPAWRHHDDRYWTERNDYKDSDFRYRSGHRGYWHDDYDEQYENRPKQYHHQESFWDHVGEGIRDGWNNMFHRRPHDVREEERREDHQRRRDHEQKFWREDPDYRNAGPDHRDEDFRW